MYKKFTKFLAIINALKILKKYSLGSKCFSFIPETVYMTGRKEFWK